MTVFAYNGHIAWQNLKQLYRHRFQFKPDIDDICEAEKERGPSSTTPMHLFCGT